MLWLVLRTTGKPARYVYDYEYFRLSWPVKGLPQYFLRR